ncbi:tRNA lysidine(34) synthetase TilS [Rhodococcus antarcticus]|uniref:tRNA(Ile)-lysidine synthase n=1 Tax=Rhodococcus antarcticus TaxID=2987751 RepID=A0ABY6NYF1_9NOCA|nr:tRNA lysidine(34) synthetase TilS [Rhodococcus antarcticus]UZJ24429.1 tRNA lysidine(34) synthetase TilS [Rhodococcus antarcticus]
MSAGPDPAVADVRRAVRRWRAEHAPDADLAVAVSGGADSLALLAGAVHEVGGPVLALVVDHQLQPGSADTAEAAARAARGAGAQARVLTVRVVGSGGLEAAARRARYAALRAAAAGAPVLLGHTLDDQAETVLLGLGRGSGPRSLAGMRPWDAPWGRPLLGVRRAATHAACAALGLHPHHDPHNDDPTFTRVRLRHEVLPLLEDVLAEGVAPALARTAAQLREDCDVLDAQAAELLSGALLGAELDAEHLAPHPSALRRRVLRTWLLAHGASALTDDQLRWVDELLGAWRGQGGVSVGGGLVVARARGRLSTAPRRQTS